MKYALAIYAGALLGVWMTLKEELSNKNIDRVVSEWRSR